MMKINLARKRKSASAGGFTLTNITEITKIDFMKYLRGDSDGEGKRKASPLIALIISGAIVWMVDNEISEMKKSAIENVEKQVASIDKQKNEIEQKLAKIKGFEAVKQQLEEDEKAIRVKLEIVNRLLENRNLPAKMLMQVAQAIPLEVWLAELRVDSKSMAVSGGTTGYNQVSDFIKALDGTSLFSEISLKGIQENTTTAKDERIQAFSLEAKRRVVE